MPKQTNIYMLRDQRSHLIVGTNIRPAANICGFAPALTTLKMEIYHKSKLILFVLLSSLALNCYGKEIVTVSFGKSLPPWVNAKTNSGYIVDIIRTSLSLSGYEIKPFYLPYLRRISTYRGDYIDVVSDMNANTIKKEKLSGYFVADIYKYENFAFSLSKKGYQFKDMNELKKYSLLSWQGAATHLGGKYANMVKEHKKYRETHNQKAQVQLLFLNRFDVIQMDNKIFDYYLEIIKRDGKLNTEQKIDKFPLFGSSSNGFLFKNKKNRDDFVKGIQIIKRNPKKYPKINSIFFKK